jgi:phospholipase C
VGIAADAQYSPNNPIKHVVVIVQENRTPDNLFQGLCTFGAGCGPGSSQYHITSVYVDATGKRRLLQPVGLATPFDLDHSYGGPSLNGTIRRFQL